MSQPGQEKKSKEIKIEARKVITPEQVLKNRRMMRLLHVVNAYGSLTEKALNHLVFMLKEKGLDLGYKFFKIGTAIASKDLKEDMLALLYVDFLETVGRAKKLRVTSAGREAIESHPLPEEESNMLKKLIDELRPQISSIDAEVELYHLSTRRR
jgi:hypothetical protein